MENGYELFDWYTGPQPIESERSIRAATLNYILRNQAQQAMPIAV